MVCFEDAGCSADDRRRDGPSTMPTSRSGRVNEERGIGGECWALVGVIRVDVRLLGKEFERAGRTRWDEDTEMGDMIALISG